MYRKCVGKSTDCLASVNFMKYINLYNKLKKIAKQEFYAEKFFKYKNDVKKTWQMSNTIIGRNVDKKKVSLTTKILETQKQLQINSVNTLFWPDICCKNLKS